MKRGKSGYWALAMRITTQILLVIFLGVVVTIVDAGKTFGGAFDNSVIGVKGFALGSAFTGIADDASAVYYNPAGLAFGVNNDWNAEIYARGDQRSRVKSCL